jgi:hypothetical protein
LDEGEARPANSLVPNIVLGSEVIQIQPMEVARIPVRVTIPPGRRGVQAAGLIVENRAGAASSGDGVSVRVRYLIPITVSVDGLPGRTAVQIDVLRLERIRPDAVDATTEILLGVTNSGHTLPRIQSSARLEMFQGGRWRILSEFTPRTMGILPGVSFLLRQDLERRLPSGTYRLRAELIVDGRRVAPLVREFQFEGDSEADALAFNTELELSETELTMDVLPGARRTSVLRLNNHGSDPVEVTLSPLVPTGLMGVRTDELLGTDLSAAEWVDLMPRSFTLRPGGGQNIRVVGALPNDAPSHPNFYSELQISAQFRDGQSAGELTDILHLHNSREQARPAAVLDQLVLTELDDDSHAITVRMANVGNVHLYPSVRTSLIDSDGRNVWDVALSGDTDMLLPLGTRTFGGELDFSRVPPGLYVLRASGSVVLDRWTIAQRVIEVSDSEDGAKVLRIVEDVDPETLAADVEEEVN